MKSHAEGNPAHPQGRQRHDVFLVVKVVDPDHKSRVNPGGHILHYTQAQAQPQGAHDLAPGSVAGPGYDGALDKYPLAGNQTILYGIARDEIQKLHRIGWRQFRRDPQGPKAGAAQHYIPRKIGSLAAVQEPEGTQFGLGMNAAGKQAETDKRIGFHRVPLVTACRLRATCHRWPAGQGGYVMPLGKRSQPFCGNLRRVNL